MPTKKATIVRFDHAIDVDSLAKLFSSAEPWVTLKMNENHFKSILSDPLNETYVLKIDEEIIGAIILQLHGPIAGYIKSVVISEQYEGKGYGSFLLRFSEERIFKEIPNVFLCVSSFNSNAQRFYQKLGYHKVGTINNYLLSGFDEILMRKTRGSIIGYNP